MHEFEDYSGEFRSDAKLQDFSKDAILRLWRTSSLIYMLLGGTWFDVVKDHAQHALLLRVERERAPKLLHGGRVTHRVEQARRIQQHTALAKCVFHRTCLWAAPTHTQAQTQRSENLLPGDMERQRIENKRTRQAIRLAEKESNLTSQTIKKRMDLIDKELGSADLEKKYTQARIDHYNALAKDMQKRRKSDENTVRYRMLTDKLNAAVKAYSDNRELDPDVMEWVVSDPDLDAQARATIKTALSELDQLQSNIYGKKKGKGAAGSLPEYQENPLNLNMNNLAPLRK